MENEKRKSLDILFKPRNVVIYRASEKIDYFLEGYTEQNFDKDKLYLVNSELDEVFGLKCVKSIEDIPEDTIDLLILSIGRDRVINELKNLLSKKRVNIIHIFTAGMGESDEKGKDIENEMLGILNDKRYNTRAIGPNCMDVYCPEGYLAYEPAFPTKPGNISFVFQSGDLHSQTIRIGARRYGLKYSKGASIGNCLDLQISDFLNYYNEDSDTDIIGVYFEGFSRHHADEGRKLFQTLKTMNKPVLFINGGNTERAQKAVLSHTGSISSDKRIWDAIVKQAPIINVPTSMDDMIDYLYLFSTYFERFKKKGVNSKDIMYPKGKNVLLILWSGGFGIIDTNMLIESGLNVPYFDGSILEKLREIYPIKIGSLANPLDIPYITSTEKYYDVASTAISENIDVTMIETDSWGDFDSDFFKGRYNNMLKIKEFTETHNKILIIILPQYPNPDRDRYHKMLMEDGFIVYPSVRRAGKSFLALYEYGKKIKTIQNDIVTKNN